MHVMQPVCKERGVWNQACHGCRPDKRQRIRQRAGQSAENAWIGYLQRWPQPKFDSGYALLLSAGRFPGVLPDALHLSGLRICRTSVDVNVGRISGSESGTGRAKALEMSGLGYLLRSTRPKFDSGYVQLLSGGRLQDFLPDTFVSLIQATILLWMLLCAVT